MSKNIVGRHFELSDSIRDHISDSIDGLNKYNLNIISTNTIISGDSKAKAGVSFELVIKLKDKNTIVITQRDKDVYTASDTAFNRAEKALRRHADKIKDHKVMSFKDLGAEAEAILDLDVEEVEIVPMDLELHKPLDFNEAIEALKAEKKRQFIVFNDHDGLMRVMYKRVDGKFGLY
ncbi:Ribosomal subunit interface protein [hydrothermal vent metagenome]|uniref:Ribosomal subunit interface protein n=1 Tax=hydrothermal vent metagenome TaxID=652676 RepID=A0A1W1BVE6_9ZZZZ